jgi:hypothetical protein
MGWDGGGERGGGVGSGGVVRREGSGGKDGRAEGRLEGEVGREQEAMRVKWGAAARRAYLCGYVRQELRRMAWDPDCVCQALT